jgi:hypothetical protein
MIFKAGHLYKIISDTDDGFVKQGDIVLAGTTFTCTKGYQITEGNCYLTVLRTGFIIYGLIKEYKYEEYNPNVTD